jgi:hypothetical protein
LNSYGGGDDALNVYREALKWWNTELTATEDSIPALSNPRKSPHDIGSVEEKLPEAEYFARRLPRSRGHAHSFGLNAFLSAARSVTFLIQKERSKAPTFADWWDARRAGMRNDQAMRFFLDLRNYSQKEGRVAILGRGSTTQH